LATNYAQDFDLNIDLHLVDVDDVAPPIVKLSDAKCHASLLSSFLLENSLYFGDRFSNHILRSSRATKGSANFGDSLGYL
jgi:hypothetical protein